VDHGVSVGDLDSSSVGVRHRLHPIENKANGAVGRNCRNGVDQTLSLDHVMQ